MFVPVERLTWRLRGQPASRADEVARVRARLRAERRAAIEPAEQALVDRVHAAKLAVAAAIGDVTACASCATKQPFPVGAYAGGACCSGTTATLFDDHELVALAHAGTRAGDLAPPDHRDRHGGCAFRGAHGCSLALAHRPARCVHYVCETLRAELHRAGRLDDVEARLATLDLAMRELTAAHRARLDRETLAPIVRALERARR